VDRTAGTVNNGDGAHIAFVKWKGLKEGFNLNVVVNLSRRAIKGVMGVNLQRIVHLYERKTFF